MTELLDWDDAYHEDGSSAATHHGASVDHSHKSPTSSGKALFEAMCSTPAADTVKRRLY